MRRFTYVVGRRFVLEIFPQREVCAFIRAARDFWESAVFQARIP